MKILHILYSGLGGHGNVFFSMVDADIGKEHMYTALFFGIEDVREEYIKQAELRNISWHFVKKKPGLDFSSYRKIERIIKEVEPDIVFLHTSAYIFPALKATFFAGRKIRIVVRETQAHHLKSNREWIGLSVALLFAHKVVFLSTEYRDAVRKKLRIFFRDRKTSVIPNGIDLEVYKPGKKVAQPFFKIGMQSRLTENKDHTTLIEAFSLLQKELDAKQPIKLYIAGEGSSKKQLQRQVADLELSDSVVFTGMLDETALPGFINSLDFYVHATLGETMSTALMQVMACGVPIVASDVLGVNNMIIHNRTGLLVPVKNPAAMCRSIIKLFENADRAAELSGNALQFAQHNFSNKTMFDKYNHIFRSDRE